MATNKIGQRVQTDQSGLHSANVLPQIALVDGNLDEGKFLVLMNQLPMFPTHNKKYTYWEDDWLPANDTTSAAVAAGAVTIDVTTVLAYNVGQTWKNKRTGEVVFITGVSESAAQITVSRAVGRDSTNSTGTAAAAMNSGDTLVRMVPSMGERSTRQIAQSTTPVERFNYSEKLRWEVSMTDVQAKTKHETGYDWPYQLDKTMRQARKDMNGWLYAGERNTKTVNGQKHWFSGGLNFFISTNSLTGSGTLHEYTLDDWMVDEGGRYGPSMKDLLASSGVIKAINQIGKDYISIERSNLGTKDLAVGAMVRRYVSPTGVTMEVHEDRWLSENYSGYGYVVDFGVCRLRNFAGPDDDGHIKIYPNTQDTDADDIVATIRGDLGMEWGPEKHHGVMTGVTAGARGRSVS